MFTRRGGGNVLNSDMDSRKTPLRWMVYEAVAAGLRMDVFDGWTKETEDVIEVHESLTCIWWILELPCIKYLSYKGKQNTRRLYVPFQCIPGDD